MRLPTFREIGNNLKERFDKASRVRANNDFRGVSGNKYKYKKSIPLETYEKGIIQFSYFGLLKLTFFSLF